MKEIGRRLDSQNAEKIASTDSGRELLRSLPVDESGGGGAEEVEK